MRVRRDASAFPMIGQPNGPEGSDSEYDGGSRFIVVGSPAPADPRLDDFNRSEAGENGDADTSEGEQVNENPKQVLYEGHCLSRMQYNGHYWSNERKHG